MTTVAREYSAGSHLKDAAQWTIAQEHLEAKGISSPTTLRTNVDVHIGSQETGKVRSSSRPQVVACKPP